MNEAEDLFPVVQPLDDPGVEPSDSKDLKFLLPTNEDESELPEDLLLLVKQRLQAKPNQGKEPLEKATKKSKKDATEEAFPLEPRSHFWRKLLTTSNKNGNEDGGSDRSQPKSVVSYVAFNPADKDSMVSKNKELVLNPKLMKSLDEKMAGDKVHVIEKRVGKHTLKKRKKKEREKTKGEGWFGMSAPEMTEETKRDLEVLKMRAAVDPKRFYKKNDSQTLPKYFQIGQVVDSPVDYYSNKGGGKKKKKSLVDELMADAEYQKYSKRKYAEIIDEKAKLDPRKRHKKKKAKQKE